jgi:hypothetical protein
MPQISLYIDEKTLKKIENAAAREHISISKWVAEQIKAKIEPVYPVDFENLFGSIKDKSFKKPENLDFKDDSERAKL